MRLRTKPAATAVLGLCLTAVGLASCDEAKPWGSGRGFGIDGVPLTEKAKKHTDKSRMHTGGAVGASEETTAEVRDNEVQQILRGWRGSSRHGKNLIVAKFRADKSLHAPLLRIIELESRFLVPAIEIAGRIELQDAVPFLNMLVLSGKPRPRAAAIVALDRFTPWPNERLTDFLGALDEEVLLAALAVCKDRSRPPVRPMIHLLGDNRHRIRLAAYGAMPEVCDDENAQRELLQLTENQVAATATVATQALGDFEEFPGRQKRLAKLVSANRLTVRLAAQKGLARSGRRLSNEAIQALHRRLLATKTGILEKLECLMALERTRSIDAAWLFRNSKTFHPTVRMHVARCLVLAGHPGGVEILIEGLSVKETPQVSDEDVDYILAGSRAILAELLGRDVGDNPAAWRQHVAELRHARPKRIRFQPWKVH